MLRSLRLRRTGIALAALALAGSLVAPSQAAPAAGKAAQEKGQSQPQKKAEKLARSLVKKADGADAQRHLIAFQRIAERNGGNRAAGTPGYDASVDYVAGLLRRSGYAVRTPTFTYEQRVGPDGTLVVGAQSFPLGLLTESIAGPEGGTTAPLVAVPQDATPGCEASDFAGLPTGAIVLVRRGACTFLVKAQNATAAGAAQVVVANNAPGDLTTGTLGEAAPVPVGFVDQASGDTLFGLVGQGATADPSTEILVSESRNIVAQTRQGRTDNVVMAGAHLDGVEVGPGINDNGSGSAGLLEVALELGGDAKVQNAVRFAWWGAEEIGLLGADAYVASLPFERQLDIALYLNFDMIGSPNAAYFAYDGDDSDVAGAGPGPFGSAQLEDTLTTFLQEQRGVPTQGTDFDGRSDYGPFIAVGIPSGGLFTGAEGIKTPEQAALWGGTAGVAYDPCYHSACDDLANIDRVAFDRNIDAIAWSMGTYASSTEAVNGVPPRARRAALRSSSTARAAAPATAPVVGSALR